MYKSRGIVRREYSGAAKGFLVFLRLYILEEKKMISLSDL
jgi:hypothetical protein